MIWQRASEITEPGAYWVDDRRPSGKSRGHFLVTNVFESLDGFYAPLSSNSRHGTFLVNWDKNIYLYGPLKPPKEES